jgi:hypothetical protein
MISLALQLEPLELKLLQNPVHQTLELFGPLHEPLLQALDHDFAAPDNHAAAPEASLAPDFSKLLMPLAPAPATAFAPVAAAPTPFFTAFPALFSSFADGLE